MERNEVAPDTGGRTRRRASLGALSAIAAVAASASERRGSGGARLGTGPRTGTRYGKTIRRQARQNWVATINSLSGEDAEAMSDKRHEPARRRREMQRFNEHFLEPPLGGLPKLRLSTSAPQLLDPSHVPEPPPELPAPTVVYVSERVRKHGYKAGVVEAPGEWCQYLDRERQLDFNMKELGKVYDLNFDKVRAKFEEARDLRDAVDWNSTDFCNYLNKELAKRGGGTVGLKKARRILRLLGFEVGMRADGAHYDARLRPDVVAHRDALLPFLARIHADKDLFYIIDGDGSWFSDMNVLFGYVNTVAAAGSVSRGGKAGIDMGMFGFVSAEDAVVANYYFEKKKGEKLGIGNDDIIAMCKQVAEIVKGLDSAQGMQPVLLLDGARTNTKAGEGVFDLTTANLLTQNPDNDLTGTRSMKDILNALDEWEEGMSKAQAAEKLRSWKNQYSEQLLNIEREMLKHGILVVFLPHSHPELAWIEYWWRKLKSAARASGSSKRAVLRERLIWAEEDTSSETIAKYRRTSESFIKFYLNEMDSQGGDNAGNVIDRPTEYQAVKRFGEEPWPEDMMAELPPKPDGPLAYSSPSPAWRAWRDALWGHLHMCNMMCRFGKSFPVGTELWEKPMPAGTVGSAKAVPRKKKKKRSKRSRSSSLALSIGSESAGSDSDDLPAVSGRGSVPASLDYMRTMGTSRAGRVPKPVRRD